MKPGILCAVYYRTQAGAIRREGTATVPHTDLEACTHLEAVQGFAEASVHWQREAPQAGLGLAPLEA